MQTISSRANPIVQTFRTLAARADPEGARLLLDGVHLLREALASGAELEVVAVAASHLAAGTDEGALADALSRQGVEVVAAADRALAALSPVRTSSGIVAIARRKVVAAEDVCSRPSAFVVTAVDVQDPGNVGALLRAAEAAGASGAFVCGTSASPFSWKAVRGSMGSVLRLDVVGNMAVEQAVTHMRSAGLKTIAAVPRGGRHPDEVDWRGGVALLLGGEGPGLTPALVAACESRVTIPMAPPVESLNVAVAAGILCYAARRQRNDTPSGVTMSRIR